MTDPRVHQIRLREFNVPAKFRAMNLDDFEPRDKAQGVAYDVASDFVANLGNRYVPKSRPLSEYPTDSTQIGKGLLFFGPPGTGKTTLAVSTLLQVYYTYNMAIYCLSMAELIRMTTRQFALASVDTAEAQAEWWQINEHLERAANAPVIMLDDIGKEYKTSSGFAVSEVDILLRNRNTSARPTILTSNLPPENWARVYTDSMGSFIHEAFDIVPMVGKDQRRN